MDTDAIIETWKNARLEGWCEEATARRLIKIVADVKPDIAVEIGVFGGKSLIPQALTMKEAGTGIIYGIDPWSKNDALEGMLEKDSIDYWSRIDYEQIYQGVKDRVEVLKLERQVVLLRDTSANAAGRFTDSSIGLLHIDGNHSEESSPRDAQLYLPKVMAGGFIYVDDTGWHEGGTFTTQLALNYLLSNGCKVVDNFESEIILQKDHRCPH